MKKIKVNLLTDSHSTGRGIGFYAKNLKEALKNLNHLKITDIDYDLIHYPYFDLFYPTLKTGDVPTVVTIHDLTPLVLKDLYPKGIRGTFNLFRQKRALRKVGAVITDSFNSKNDLIDILGLDPKKIHVVPLASDPIYTKKIPSTKLAEVKQKYSLPDDFILYVGGANPNKNLGALVKAASDLNLNLVLVGSDFTKEIRSKGHPELRSLEFIQAAKKARSQIYTPGFVPDEDLLAIYKMATLYCQPSLYEGFGLPLLEAMNAGCLIVSSCASSLPEIYPKNTITFDPKSQQSLNNALRTALKLTSSQKKELILEGILRAKDFTWEKTAFLTAHVYSLLIN